ncbi:c-type cytochrome [Marinomonas communis]|uniref:Cbb3-type cytochrome c oxidase subunit III n=1 Tax=Marinomonas communis TaxID=28254 RepID=A0A4R6X702_9GAMM|nr:cytochrome c [Marinomonas communis]TDR12503.1 cbb3-type cytochrome c oxidase subunit III [Marinomonas communis]
MKSIFMLLGIALLTGCSDQNTEKSDLQSGKALYGQYCASCHKDSGRGQFLLGIPRNKDTQMSINEIAHLIRSGHPNLEKMPTFPQLSSPQAYAISSYLKHKLGAE